MAATSVPQKTSVPQNYFVTTRWSVVLAAGKHDSTRAGVALEKLCRAYWYPLYAYVRRRGYSPHDAQDLTQSFFASLLEHQSIVNADPERGRFRSFILGAMNHFLATEWAKRQTQKRGGGKSIVSLDLAAAEERFDLEPSVEMPIERAFDREWATALLEQVIGELEEEFRRENRLPLFNALKRTLAGSREAQPYAEIARELRMNESAVKTAVHRLRKRYRELLEAEIAHTVASPSEVKEELRYLLTVISGA